MQLAKDGKTPIEQPIKKTPEKKMPAPIKKQYAFNPLGKKQAVDKYGAAGDELRTSSIPPPIHDEQGKYAFIGYKEYERRVRKVPEFKADQVDESKIFHQWLIQEHHVCVYHAINMYLGCSYFHTYWQCIRVTSANTKKSFTHHNNSRIYEGLPISNIKHGICSHETPLEIKHLAKVEIKS